VRLWLLVPVLCNLVDRFRYRGQVEGRGYIEGESGAFPMGRR